MFSEALLTMLTFGNDLNISQLRVCVYCGVPIQCYPVLKICLKTSTIILIFIQFSQCKIMLAYFKILLERSVALFNQWNWWKTLRNYVFDCFNVEMLIFPSSYLSVGVNYWH